jgi:hypothetical protein
VELAPRIGTAETPALGAIALVSERNARVWVYDRAATTVLPASGATSYAQIQVLVPGLPPGPYRVGVWDTRLGKELATLSCTGLATGIMVDLPPFTVDCALKIDPAAK